MRHRRLDLGRHGSDRKHWGIWNAALL